MIPLYSTRQVREADIYAINNLGIPGIALMENAARSIYEQIFYYFPDTTSDSLFGIICGKGNNGGDGYALARHLLNSDFDVVVISLGNEDELNGDALTNYKITKSLLKLKDFGKLVEYKNASSLNALKNCDFIIDAMLGTGSAGELRDPYKTIIEKVNESEAVRIAVDLPTGLDADTGYGETIFDADLTVTLAEFKKGLFFEEGCTNCGKVVKGQIGIGDEYFYDQETNIYIVEPEDALYGLPVKGGNIHKYSSGKVLTIAGSGHLPGAAFFAANTALKVGAGASILAFPASLKELAQAKLDSSVVLPYNDDGKEYLALDNLEELEERIEWADVVAVGPGLGREPETVQAIAEIFRKFPKVPFVVDADAITAIGEIGLDKVNLKNKVLTPHHGEFAQLLQIPVKQLKKDVLRYGTEFVKQTGAYLVLKGAPTLVFNPSCEIFANSTGNAGMAKFGNGDVLTGNIAGFLAQNGDIESSVISAVYLHSLSADLLMKEKTVYGFTATDIMENLPYAIKFISDTFI